MDSGHSWEELLLGVGPPGSQAISEVSESGTFPAHLLLSVIPVLSHLPLPLLVSSSASQPPFPHFGASSKPRVLASSQTPLWGTLCLRLGFPFLCFLGKHWPDIVVRVYWL